MFEKRARSAVRLVKRHRLWRPLHIFSALFVLSYISFHVLDLDLSEFPLKQTASETTVAVVEAPETVELTNVMGEDSSRILSSLLQPSLKESIRFQQKNLLQHIRFRETRIRLHQLTIPHSSTLDSSPAA